MSQISWCQNPLFLPLFTEVWSQCSCKPPTRHILFSALNGKGHWKCSGKQSINKGLLCMKVKVKVTQSCPTLCNLRDYTVHGILQARILKWVASSFSRGSFHPSDPTQISSLAGKFYTTEPPGKTHYYVYFGL